MVMVSYKVGLVRLGETWPSFSGPTRWRPQLQTLRLWPGTVNETSSRLPYNSATFWLCFRKPHMLCVAPYVAWVLWMCEVITNENKENSCCREKKVSMERKKGDILFDKSNNLIVKICFPFICRTTKPLAPPNVEPDKHRRVVLNLLFYLHVSLFYFQLFCSSAVTMTFISMKF